MSVCSASVSVYMQTHPTKQGTGSSISLVLMDCHMPVIDGFETTRRIREIEKECGSHIPIIGVSAGVMDEEVMSLAAGMNDFISKPVENKILKEKIAYYLSVEFSS